MATTTQSAPATPDQSKKAMLTIGVSGVIGLAGGFGVAYLNKTKMKWYGYVGFGLLGIALSTVPASFFIPKGAIKSVFKKSGANAKTTGGTGDVTPDELSVYNDVKAIAVGMGAGADKVAKESDFVAKYRGFSDSEKNALKDFVASAKSVDLSNTQQALSDMQKINDELTQKYGAETMKKVLA
jgi:hypothetical protein